MRIWSFIAILSLAFSTRAQVIVGEVSYQSAQNYYVRFSSTEQLAEGDTLFQDNLASEPCLLVLKKSSLSVVAQNIGDCQLQKGSKLYAQIEDIQAPEESPEISESLKTVSSASKQDSLSLVRALDPQIRRGGKRGLFRARLSYDNANVYRIDDFRGSTRNNLRSSVTWDSLAGKNLRFESYFNAQHFLRSYESSADPYRLNFYNLALVYGQGADYQIVLGRRINRRISSLGAIDGLQYEAKLGHWKFGAIAGSRPDFGNFALNLNLMQYGGYVAYDYRFKSSQFQSTVGIVQQMNNGGIDRRYLYTQNSWSYRSLFLFGSAELDLYQNFDTATASNNLKLSSLYLSMRYRISSKLNLFVSYDSRQQIIFFEQFDSEIELLLSEQGTRQGFRTRLNYRPSKSTNLGIAYNLRQATNPDEGAQNYSAYISQRLPWVGGYLSYRFNLNQNYFLASEINSLRYSRYFANNKLYTSVYYRYLSYLYPNREIVIDPVMYMGMDLSYRFANDWSLGLLGEYNLNYQQDLIRINFRLTKNFSF